MNDNGVINMYCACIEQAKKDIVRQPTIYLTGKDKGKRSPQGVKDVKNAIRFLEDLGAHKIVKQLIKERNEDKYGKIEY